jgi:hypothetical protein
MVSSKRRTVSRVNGFIHVNVVSKGPNELGKIASRLNSFALTEDYMTDPKCSENMHVGQVEIGNDFTLIAGESTISAHAGSKYQDGRSLDVNV